MEGFAVLVLLAVHLALLLRGEKVGVVGSGGEGGVGDDLDVLTFCGEEMSELGLR